MSASENALKTTVGPALKMQQLELSLANTSILQDINFAIKAGEVHCLVGPNGGGKTSLLRCLLGQMPHRGTVTIDYSQSPDELPRVTGYVPQQLHMEKTLPLTVNDFMAIACESLRPVFFGRSKARKVNCDELLDRVGLGANKRRRPVGSLSGGERQRLLFAQAMIPQPSLLLLDEPLSSLDQGGARQLIDLIAECSSRGTTIVWVAHELSLVREVADSVSCISRRLLATGSVDDVLNNIDPDILYRPVSDSVEAVL